MKRVYLVSLGCPKALVDSEAILGLLEKRGYLLVDTAQGADLLMVNTCAFIQDATQESIDTILTLAQGKKEGQTLAVVGCLPQRYKGKIEKLLPEVDLWIDLHSLEHLPSILDGQWPPPSPHTFLPLHTMPRHRLTPRTWAYLKIAEGCNNRCRYCTIPSIRGPLRSRPPGDIIAEAKKLVKGGALEVNLIAQDITRYGEDLGYKNGLLSLLDALEKIEGLQWVRLMYAHPAGVTRELVTRLGQGKVLPYLEMPIQHVSQRVLEAMGRRGGRRAVMDALEALGQEGEISLRTTVMVGFPTEGEKEFQELMDFLSQAPLFRLAAFAYSPEEGTPAATLAQIPEEERRRRLNEVLALQEELHFARNMDLVGRRFPILMEEPAWGRFPGQAPEIDGRVQVKAEAKVKVEVEGIREVIVTEADGVDLYGEPG